MTAGLLRTSPPAAPEHDHRVSALRARMAERGLAAAAFASPEAIYYLTGLDHYGYFAFTLLVVPVDGPPMLVTREMERPTVRAQVPHCKHLTYADGTDPDRAVGAALATVPSRGKVAVEDAAMFFPPKVHARLRRTLRGKAITNATPLLSPSMAVKSPDEITAMRRAAAISDAAMAAGVRHARPDGTESAVAAAAHHAMYSSGGQQPGFAPLIRPLRMLDQEHVSWGDRTLVPGTGLFIELSGCYRRYHAPSARTVYLGHAPDGAEEAHAAAHAGLGAALAELRPGVRTGAVYAAWRAAAGVTADRHHCGYLVGIGFPPSWVGGGDVLGIRPGGTVQVVEGMTFHLMSWVPGHVVSDTVLVTSSGAELLTTSPRELTVVT